MASIHLNQETSIWLDILMILRQRMAMLGFNGMLHLLECLRLETAAEI